MDSFGGEWLGKAGIDWLAEHVRHGHRDKNEWCERVCVSTSKFILRFCIFVLFFFSWSNVGQCSGDDDGRRAGICHPADDNGQTAVWPSRQDDRSARNLVFRAPVYGQQELLHLAQAQQEGSQHSLISYCLVSFTIRNLLTVVPFFSLSFSLCRHHNKFFVWFDKPNDYVKDIFRFILGRGYCQDQVHLELASWPT